MARNPKLDLAKRQAVGIYRAVPRWAEEATGEFRTPDAAKSFYNQGKAQPVDVTGLTVRKIEGGHITRKDSRAMVGNRHVASLNHKTSRATPQSRAHMNTFAFRSRQAPAAIIRWVPEGTQVLIPATR
jgi:hypothetical protein